MCDKVVCDIVVCEKLCVTKLCENDDFTSSGISDLLSSYIYEIPARIQQATCILFLMSSTGLLFDGPRK